MKRAGLALAFCWFPVLAMAQMPPAPPPLAGNPPGREVMYICPGGQDFSARFSADAEEATLVVPGQPDVELPRLTSGSGFTYGDSYYELRGRGREVTLAARGGGSMRCHAAGRPGAAIRSFAGTVPNGNTITLALLPDGVFRLRERTSGSDTQVDHGIWNEQVEGGLRLVLRGGAVAKRSFREGPAGRLVGVDLADLELNQVTLPDPIDESFRLNGLFYVAPTGGVFTECLTGRNFYLAPSDSEQQLERAWTDSTSRRDTQIYASIVGRFRGDALLAIERFIGLKPGENCAALPVPGATLRGTEWRVIQIGAEKLAIDQTRQLPTLILDEQSGYTGSTGCNRYGGVYALDADGLRFAPGMMTRMSCAQPADATVESRFLEALAAVTQANVSATTLDLLDVKGTRQLRLEAIGR